MDFLFHKISESERKEIEKQAKKIINDFAKQLDKVKEKVGDSFIEIGEGQREENTPHENNFSREIMFENAPNKNKDFILGEKKGW